MKFLAQLLVFHIIVQLTLSTNEIPTIIVAEITSTTTPAPILYPGFSRSCSNSQDCQFTNGVVKNTVYLNCEDDVCVCERLRYITDVPAWNLKWNGKECAIAESGPCGENQGLKLVCQEGLECLEGRCRDSTKIHGTPLNHSCNENIDCQEELVCKVTGFYFSITKSCVKPETPALSGYDDQ
jgi:hypothetical protein